MNKIKNIFLLGVITILTLVLISSASAEVNCVDFKDAEEYGIYPGQSIEGFYWNDILEINATTNTVYLVEANNTTSPAFSAYEANNESGVNLVPNGYLKDYGIALKTETFSQEEIFEFTFNGTILVKNFSLELFDFGDYDRFELGYVNATLIAYNTSGSIVDTDSINVTEINTTHDAQNGSKILEVAGGIAYVELITNPTERFAIDNICFDVNVSLDVKPSSCPNPINVNSKGVLPIAIAGSENFDVTQIDPATVRLGLMEKDGDFLNVTPLRWSYEDVTCPYLSGPENENPCCIENQPDDIMDLSMKFKTQELVGVAGLESHVGETIKLTVAGETLDGLKFMGEDCVRILVTNRVEIEKLHNEKNKNK